MQALASQWTILEQRGLLVCVPTAATIKWLASTFQPTKKLVIEPASAIVWNPWCQPWRFNGPFWNTVWLLVWFPSAATIKLLAWTFQPTKKIGDWASICHPFVFLDFASNASKCKPWPLNELFWNSVGYLYDVPTAATIKWLASTFQPTMKLVIEPAPATLLGWNCPESWVFNPITNLKLGWWVEANHLVVARCGNLCKQPTR